MTCISSTEAPKNRASFSAPIWTSSRLRNSGFCVATPTGQLFELHMRAAMQPTACMAEFDTAIVVVNEATCDLEGRPWPLTANILTQRGQTPILLTGCCEATP